MSLPPKRSGGGSKSEAKGGDCLCGRTRTQRCCSPGRANWDNCGNFLASFCSSPRWGGGAPPKVHVRLESSLSSSHAGCSFHVRHVELAPGDPTLAVAPGTSPWLPGGASPATSRQNGMLASSAGVRRRKHRHPAWPVVMAASVADRVRRRRRCVRSVGSSLRGAPRAWRWPVSRLRVVMAGCRQGSPSALASGCGVARRRGRIGCEARASLAQSWSSKRLKPWSFRPIKRCACVACISSSRVVHGS